MTHTYPLAIFTEPLSPRNHLQHLKSYLLWLLFGRKNPYPLRVGGHYAVTRSLFSGLRQIGKTIAYNPDLSDAVIETAIILSSSDRLKEICALKKAGKCKHIFAGPNIVVRPGDADGVMLSPEITSVITPSQWVKDMYVADGPLSSDKVAVWAAGIDETWWKSWRTEPAKDIIIYDKNMPALAEEIEQMLAARALPHRIIRYGDYTAQTYRDALNRAAACIFLTESESQGLALVEAWAMDVPTFVIQRDNRVINGLSMNVSTAPYLSSQTGALWQNQDQLNHLLLNIHSYTYAPRQWVLENMTDALCAREMLKLAHGDAS